MDNKKIAIFGASSGIGLALARQLSQAGAQVYSFSRSEPNISGLTHQTLDVTEKDFSNLQLPDSLDGLVYCPGSINLKPFNALKANHFQEDFELNALGAVKVLQACYKPLRASKGASVVLFSTVAVQMGMSYHASVAMAKGAVEGLARSLAAEWATQHIRVNVIAPSLTDTPLASQLLSSEEKKKASNQRHPLGRYGQPEDIAHAAKYLLSEESSWLTGQVLHLDGGMSSIKPL
jgi:NAD(P)-dependent dehydrogenase (short-subunit alcohol dehydrogenase family)